MLTLPLLHALTFDDVLLVPGFSEVHPNQVDLQTQLTRDISLRIPLVSAAMDTVTESRMAIGLAQMGGIGIVHKNLSPERPAEEVDKVKRSESGMITDPITIEPDAPIRDAEALMAKFRISGVPVVEGHRLVGILTNRDLRFETRWDIPVREAMTKDNLVTVPVGTTLQEARAILQKHRIEKLLVVDGQGQLKGLITVKDIEKSIEYPNACKDGMGRLRVGAAVGVGKDLLDRAAVTYQLVLTKTDGVRPAALAAKQAQIAGYARKHPAAFPEIVSTSAETGAGIDLLRASLAVQTGRADAAAEDLRVWVADHPRDATAWQLLSSAYTARHETLRSIRAEAEARIAHLDYAAARDRLRAAQDLAAQGAAVDAIESSIIDARARELDSTLKEQALER